MPFRLLLLIITVIALTGCSSAPKTHTGTAENPMRLWYDAPATIWEEALPIGNGRIGAMVYGGIEEETIQLNEETVWAGEPGNNILPAIKIALPKIRQLIFEEKYEEAQQLADEYLPRKAGENNNYGMCYQPVGKLLISTPATTDAKNYSRELDIANSVSRTHYTTNGIAYQREIISSLADDVIAIKITADQPGAVSCTLAINSPHVKQSVKTENGALWLHGTSSDYENKKGKVTFTTIVKPKLSGGQLVIKDSSLIISRTDTLVIYISIATNFKNYNDISAEPDLKAQRVLNAAYPKEFARLKQSHTDVYKTFFDRVAIDLGSTDSIKNPTDVRLAQYKNGNDPQLVALYFQYGRYLLISSSQAGTQAANLQGLWNDKIKPSWDSKYTVNINTEMNYWPAEVTNLSEMHQPLFDLVDNISETGAQSASKMYGARGWNIHHNTDIWRISGVVDGSYYGFWPMGGAWLSQHLWYHYIFTGDKQFLKEKFPLLKGASLFLKDVLQREPEHDWLVVCPSMSPENSHRSKTTISAGTTMDNQLVFDVFNNVIEAADILGIEKVYADSLRDLLTQLPPMQIGNWGQLQEWMHDWDKTGDKHRHVSHLYGLFPSDQISPYQTPELFAAAKTSLLARGDESTGWSMGWKVNLWARLLDGNHALKLIADQLSPSIQTDGSQKGGTYPNLFDAHPPFQIDGNFGCTSGIAEMMLQSHDGAIHLLPAKPDAWKEGHIKGLKARGGFVIEVQWSEGELSAVTIKSSLGGNCRIRSYVPLQGDGLILAKGDNSNQFFKHKNIKPPLIHTQKDVLKAPIKKIYEYDISTEKEDVIKLRKMVS